MTRRTKQAKVFALLSLLLSGSSFCHGMETGVVTGSQNYTTDQTIDVAPPNPWDDFNGFLIRENETVYAQLGTTITINMRDPSNRASGGVRLYGPNAVFDVDKLIVTDEYANVDGMSTSEGSFGVLVHDGIAKIGDESIIKTAYTALGASGNAARIEVGNDALISSNVFGSGSGTVYASFGGNISIGDRATIINDGRPLVGLEYHHFSVYAPQGNIEVGDNSKIGAYGNGAYLNVGVGAGVQVYGTAGTVTIGKNAQIEAFSGSNPIALYSINNGSKITIKEATSTDSYIKAVGNGGRAAYAARGAKIELKSGQNISAIGNNVQTIQAVSGGEIELGNGQNILARGDDGNAIRASQTGSKITIGSGSTIVTEGLDSYAIVASDGGEVELIGDQTITVDLDRTPYAIVAYGDDAGITGDGKLAITGGIYAGDMGKVNLTLRNLSIFKGETTATGVDQAGELNLTMHVGSQWRMTGNSQVSNLNLLGGAVYFETDLSSGQYGTLRVRNLTSDPGLSSTFFMRTDIVNEIGDRLLVTGTSSGRHMIYVANQGSQATTGNERFTLVETADGIATFAAADLIELGGYVYDIQRAENQNQWELYPRLGGESGEGGGSNESSTASGAKNIYLGSYLLNYAENQTLLKRLGDLRDGAESSGIWARVYGGKFDKSSDRSGRGFDMDYHGVQAGFDKKINSKSQKRTEYVGGFAGYSKGSLDYSRGSGDTELKYLGAYWAHLQSNGFYLDTVLKYGWMDSDFKVRDTHGDWVKGKGLDTNTWSGSLEVGKKFYRNSAEKSGWYVEPQAQLTLSHQKGDEITASNGLRVKVNSLNSIQGRLGLRAGYEIKGGKNPVNLYAKVSQVKEFDGEMEYYLNGSKEKTSYKDNWWVYGVGMNAQLGTRHQVYFDVEKTSGDKFDQDWGVSGGYRYSW